MLLSRGITKKCQKSSVKKLGSFVGVGRAPEIARASQGSLASLLSSNSVDRTFQKAKTEKDKYLGLRGHVPVITVETAPARIPEATIQRAAKHAHQ